ncbi:MAG TPA: neocarzinostatin apoprotein domain-containing protein [Acidimicrobiales bacterium]|nr:neocarzinostatin apoprotein domain-containing protein [Acidimicrobiales bacterium]
MSTRGLRAVLSIALVGITGLSFGFVGVTSGSAATGPKVVVRPSTNLHNGEVVHVSGSGFKAGDTVYFVECLAKAKGQSGCLVKGIPPYATISSKGLLPRTSFKVSTGKVGSGKGAGTCGTTKTNLRNCAVSVGNATGGDSGVGLIAFRAPAKK